MERFFGCSGWHYADWDGLFYPAGLSKTKWLKFYAEKFNTVEINNTFYRIPLEKTFEKWYAESPKGFKFAVKGNRFITHLKKLIDVEEQVHDFCLLAGLLKEKLGCILWQLPPSFRRNDERLESFCQMLDKDAPHVIEFRHLSWFTEEVAEILKKYNISFCAISAPGFPEQIFETSDLAYIRFHGKAKSWYRYDYSEEELELWANRIKKLSSQQVYAFFNNDYEAHAIGNCETLLEFFP